MPHWHSVAMEVGVGELGSCIINRMPWLVLPVLDDGGGGVQELVLVPADVSILCNFIPRAQ